VVEIIANNLRLGPRQGRDCRFAWDGSQQLTRGGFKFGDMMLKSLKTVPVLATGTVMAAVV
jgi:hypothetical protein